MAAQITKKDLKEFSVSITKAMDKRLGGFEHSMNRRFEVFERSTNQRFEEFTTSVDRRFEVFERSIDKRFEIFEHAIIQTVSKQLEDFEQRNNAHFYVIETRLGNLEQRMEEFDRKLDRLMNTLDAFLKRLIDLNDEFTILKAEVDLIKNILKDKLGVEVALQK